MEEFVIASRRLYEGKILNLRVDSVRLTSGKESQREIVEHGNAVTILPITDDGELILVRQFRLAAGRVLLEAPAGNMDGGESPEETAHRELREETGQDCRTLRSLPSFFPAPGFSEEYMYCFLATDLFESPATADEDEELLKETVSLTRALELIQLGEIVDAKTIACVLAYKAGLVSS